MIRVNLNLLSTRGVYTICIKHKYLYHVIYLYIMYIIHLMLNYEEIN